MPYYSFTVARSGVICLLNGSGSYPVKRFDGAEFDMYTFENQRVTLAPDNRCQRILVPGVYRVEYREAPRCDASRVPTFEYTEGAGAEGDTSTLINNGDGTFTHTAGGVSTTFRAGIDLNNPAALQALANAIAADPTSIQAIANGIAGDPTSIEAITNAIAADPAQVESLMNAMASNPVAVESTDAFGNPIGHMLP